MHTRPVSELQRFLHSRWLILFFSVLSMVAVANFQYGWTLFVPPLQKHLRAEQAAVQVTFTVFVLLETWLVPFEGWLVDKFGPRLLVMIGGVCAGLGWVGSGKAEALNARYLAYAVAGLGAGVVYGTAIGSALKWFPDHRGLAAGLTAAGFGAGSALTVYPIANMIDTAGYQHAFTHWGLIQGAVVIVAALFLEAPPPGWLPHAWARAPQGQEVKKRQTSTEVPSGQMAATSQFWVLYLMMTLVATGGLMAAICGDFFGRKHATQNYGFLYTAKGTASVFVPIGSALAAGKAFDFRADVLLLLGGALAFFSHFLAPTVLRLDWRRKSHDILFGIGLALVAYGVALTVVPGIWTPFAAKFTLPRIGWAGVFAIAIVFDLSAAAIAFFVLRTMKLPQSGKDAAVSVPAQPTLASSPKSV